MNEKIKTLKKQIIELIIEDIKQFSVKLFTIIFICFNLIGFFIELFWFTESNNNPWFGFFIGILRVIYLLGLVILDLMLLQEVFNNEKKN